MIMTDKELGTAVEAWGRAHRAELVKDLIFLVNHKSVSQPGEGGFAFGTDCKKCADAMKALSESYGFDTENDDYYTMSVLMRGSSKKELGILGHLDVVPEGEGWHYDPYHAVEKDGFVIGRGSSDNKGGVMMSLYVMRALKELGVSFDHTIRLICGFNEESGMKDVEHYLEGHTAPDYTIVCDGGWAMCIGEKGILNTELVIPVSGGNLVSMTAGTVSNAVSGSAQAIVRDVDAEAVEDMARSWDKITVERMDGCVKITAAGKAAHAAFPWGGDNANHTLFAFLNAGGFVTGEAGEAVKKLARLFVDDYGTGLGIAFEDVQSGKTTCVDSVLRGGEGEIRLKLDCRFAVTQNGDELAAALKKTCAANGIYPEALSYSNPRYTDPDAPVTKMLLDTVHEFLGGDYEPYTMGGGTHARKFPNALPYGPGGVKIENPFGSPHGIDEAVSIEGLLMSMSTYAVALNRLDKALPV